MVKGVVTIMYIGYGWVITIMYVGMGDYHIRKWVISIIIRNIKGHGYQVITIIISLIIIKSWVTTI